MSTWYEQAIFLSYVSFGDNRSSKDKRADRGDRPV